MYNFLYKYITPIFGYIMLFFYGIVDGFNGNYGIAIILFGCSRYLLYTALPLAVTGI